MEKQTSPQSYWGHFNRPLLVIDRTNGWKINKNTDSQLKKKIEINRKKKNIGLNNTVELSQVGTCRTTHPILHNITSSFQEHTGPLQKRPTLDNKSSPNKRQQSGKPRYDYGL